MRVENDEDSEKKEMNNESKVKMNRLIMKMPGLSETLDMNIYEIVFILIKKNYFCDALLLYLQFVYNTRFWSDRKLSGLTEHFIVSDQISDSDKKFRQL